ncbi:type I iterative polyketide synthase [Aspergillus pseudoviridinutans]|uniref:Type I iterative polyketide synthase n=1 Tax=Aspergillus pseudoviridinutans TaxID=1517512 RepID=A0A9P3EZG6_9EURO|nr:type I iterative polyketide synthase [Aspergillus pseudoviridinutans]GIJ90983.1 type I iterative polyketide synthase [Aspergillus pseudoviridinutans]
MNQIPIFAGLGSEALFSERTLATAAEDARTPEGQIILRACHGIFVKEITSVIQSQRLPSDINLEDFAEPESLIRPRACYQRNSIIQHVSMYTIQLLRYLRHSKEKPGFLLGVAGFCAGLLPCAALATSKNTIELLSRGQDFFYVALHLGIRIETYRQVMVAKEGCPPDLPWSLVVDGITPQHTRELLEEHNRRYPSSYVYLSAINSDTCVTLSGRGDHLRQFSQSSLPSQCKIRPTTIFSLYHNRRQLEGVRMDVLQDLRNNMLLSPAPLHLIVPLFSNVDGKPIDSGQLATVEEFCEKLLEMMLLEPADWAAVEHNILATIKQSATAADACYEILNFGPGYGMSGARHNLPDNVKIVPASIVEQRPSPQDASGLLSPDDIAIVGMGVDLPGAPNTDALWQNLVDGVNSCTEIPSSRFHVEDFYQKEDGRTLRTKYGNFLENPFIFDNELFGISRREAQSMDPQQRVMLQTAYRALEDAGYVPDSTPSFSRKTFGCFIGNATLDYTDNLRDHIDVYYSPGTLRAFQSGRISYVFKWSGPSITLDTACSSSMVAIHQAARAIQAGDCRSALVGGVNVITSPDMYLGLDRAHFLSPTGQCKPFDDSADGYCRSEGCAAFVVKKLGDALSEGDRILGVIRGIEINQSGNAHSITHPHSPTQEDLFQTLLKKTQIHPHQITVVETHGTGTQAGDPNELVSIRGALCNGRDPGNLLHFTSIKANIGHCEAASGGAALAKLLLMMRHGQIPPQISLKTLNRKIKDLGTDGSVIDRDGATWPRPSRHPRLALLNNFGAAGSNGALILQEYSSPKAPPQHEEQCEAHSYMFGFSARSTTSLLAYKDVLLSYLEAPSVPSSLRDVAYTSTARRQILDYRISVTGSTIQEIVDNLRNAEIYNIRESANPQPRAVFAFSGQGSQYLGMGHELLTAYPEFKKVVLDCERWLLSNGYPGCLDVIACKDNQEQQSHSSSLLQQSLQTAVFVLEVALARLLISLGVMPTIVLGHSLGEYAALVIAGVIDLQSSLKLVAHRAKLMMELCQLETTSMLAVNLGAETVRQHIDNSPEFQDLAISCDNSHSDCVVGGPIGQLQSLKARLSTMKTKSKILDVPMAYHTNAMDPILGQLTEVAKTLEISSPRIPVLSNVFGRLIQPGEKAFTFEYFAMHCRQTVAFNAGIDELSRSGMGAEISRWVEIGPHSSLLPMVSTRLDRDATDLLPSLRKGTPASTAVARLLSHFYQTTTALNWRKAFDERATLTTLPAMPFSEQEFGIYYPHESAQRGSGECDQNADSQTGYTFLSTIVQRPSETNREAIFETPIAVLKEYILGHRVCEYALCPASVYHEIVLAASKWTQLDQGEEVIRTLSNVQYPAPLLYSEDSSVIVRVSIKPSGDHKAGYSFTVASYNAGSDSQQQMIHCQGQLKIRSTAHAEKYAKLVPLMERQKERFLRIEQSNTQVFLRKAMYEKIFTRVVQYSELYQMVQSVRIDQDEALAVCRFPNSQGDPSGANTVLMDVLLHVAGFVANLNIENDEVCICKEVKSATMTRGFPLSDTTFEVYCSNLEIAATNVVIADAYAVDSRGVIAVFKGMAFQRVKLTRMAQALRLTAARSGHSHQAVPVKRATVVAPKPPAPDSQLTDMPVDKQPAIREIIARTCNLEASNLTAETSLHAIGFDSLMMIELASNLSSMLHTPIDISALEECETVEDIEQLCSDVGESGPTPVSEAETVDSVTMPVTPATPATPSDKLLIASIIAETCGAHITSVKPDVELEALGIDSLMMIELEARLQSQSNPKKVSSSELSECRTVRDIERLANIDDAGPAQLEVEISPPLSPRSRGERQSPVPKAEKTEVSAPMKMKIAAMLRLQEQPEIVHLAEDKAPKNAPLFLIHDGSGICVQYHRLRPFNRTVYAIHDPKFLDSDSWSGIPAMAQSYARLIARTTSGPYILGGWSFGGVVAFEAARVLMAGGYPVTGVVLIDSPPPLNHKPLSANIIDAVTKGDKNRGGLVGETIRNLVRESFTACAGMLGAFKPEAVTSTSRPIPRTFLLRSRDGFLINTSNGSREVENAWLQDRSDPRTSIEGWEILTKAKMPYMDIPGDHFQVFDVANIQAVSKAVAHACNELTSTSSS